MDYAVKTTYPFLIPYYIKKRPLIMGLHFDSYPTCGKSSQKNMRQNVAMCPRITL